MNERTAEKIAKETGVSPATVHRHAQFAERMNQLPPVKRKVVVEGPEKKTDGWKYQINSNPFSDDK